VKSRFLEALAFIVLFESEAGTPIEPQIRAGQLGGQKKMGKVLKTPD
jgi:hypothetical protein